MDFSNFEQFKNTGAKLTSNTISISSVMGFGFNSGFYHKEGIKNYKYVILLYNSKDNAIGFRFTNNNSVGVFTITHTKSGTSGSIVARSFFTSFKLDQKISDLVGKYAPYPVDDYASEGVKSFFIKLDEKK